MRDQIWLREFKLEEDQLEQVKEKYKEWDKSLEPKQSLWRKRQIAFFELADKDFEDWPEYRVQRADI